MNVCKFLKYSIVCLFVFVFLILDVTAQVKDIGIPFITSYNRESYNAGTQNWDITQDENGFIYFANNNGLLRFNGKSWQQFPLPNHSIVRTLASIDGKIYVGGFDEFGFFQYNSKGQLIYTSLSTELVDKDQEFDEIWRIYDTQYGVVFQSYKKLFILNNDKIETIDPVSLFGFSYIVDSVLFVVDRQTGLYVLQQDGLKLLLENSSFFADNEITFIFSLKDNKYLIGTTNRGVFVFNGSSLEPWRNGTNKLLLESQIYTAIELPQNQIAVGTIQDGVIIFNKDGKLIQHLNRFKGLQNNTVLSLYLDHYEDLWLGLDNGIDVIEISNPISILNYTSNLETSYTSIVFNGYLYVGTNQGLFAIPFNEKAEKHINTDNFQLVDNTKGQVWSLKIIGNQLICGHNLGTFIINGVIAKKISDIPGGWTYTSVPDRQDLMIGGCYNGLILFEKSNLESTWKQIGKIKGFDESSREIVFDERGYLWVSHGYKGIFKIQLNKDCKNIENVCLYDKTNGLPKLPYTFSCIKNQFVITTLDGVYKYNSEINEFTAAGDLNMLFKGESNYARIFEDQYEDIWFYLVGSMGVLRLQEDGKYVKISIPFNRIKNSYLSDAFENAYVYDKNNIFIGGQRGLYHYNPNKSKNFDASFNIFLKDIRIKQKEKDSLLYCLYGLDKEDKSVHKFSYKYNSISFSYLSTFFEEPLQTKYSYRLLGYDDTWSDWSNLSFKEYTNLFEGDYIFEVRAQNLYKSISNIARFSFTVSPPIYRSLGAIIFYSVLLLLFVAFIFIYFRRKIDEARMSEKIKHEEVLKSKEEEFQAEVEQSEHEIEKLREDKLKNEMRHKNMELANATMHLIQKNKFLVNLKGDLMRMIGVAKVDSVKSDIKAIVKKIDKDFKNEQQWEVFDKYFDEVHQDFLARLKEAHPVLTPNDLRLCAYLKMNLSTKEIAPLMNISVRGLEISRYRLRKKLELEREINLTDYILNI